MWKAGKEEKIRPSQSSGSILLPSVLRCARFSACFLGHGGHGAPVRHQVALPRWPELSVFMPMTRRLTLLEAVDGRMWKAGEKEKPAWRFSRRRRLRPSRPLRPSRDPPPARRFPKRRCLRPSDDQRAAPPKFGAARRARRRASSTPCRTLAAPHLPPPGVCAPPRPRGKGRAPRVFSLIPFPEFARPGGALSGLATPNPRPQLPARVGFNPVLHDNSLPATVGR